MPMSGFTIKNFDAIDNAAPDDSPIDVRFGRSQIDSEHLGVTRMRYRPDARAPMGHSHREQEEVYVVTAGSGRVRLDDEIVDIGRWDIVRVAPGVIRGFEAGPDGLEFIAIGSDRPEGGDGVAAKDWWTD
jgi:mannose-6-phosphate isomerase-like protein (cupin superfamily)